MQRSTIFIWLAGVACGALGMWAFGGASDGERQHSRSSAAGELRERRAAEATLRETIRKKDAEIARLQADVDRVEQNPGESGAAAGAKPEPADGASKGGASSAKSDGKPRFIYSDQQRGLESISWDKLGTATAKLMPLLSEAQAIATGKKTMRAEFYGELTTQIGPLVSEAMRGEEAGAPWFHPSVQVNLVHATLRKAGAPLSPEQEEQLDAIGTRFIADDSRRVAGYPEGTPAVSKRIDAVLQQERMFEEIRGMLDGKQTAILYPEGIRGVVGLDMFSGSVQWDEHFDHLQHGGREDFATRLAERLARDFEWKGERATALRTAVTRWSESVPDEYFQYETAPVVRQDKNLDQAARVLDAARKQVACFRFVAAELGGDAAEKLAEYDFVLVPFKR